MQLPRGNFHSLKKDTAISALFDELTRTGFTGHCSIAVEGRKDTASIVFDNGECLLAQFASHQGMAAIEQLKEIGDLATHAELYTLTPDQITLSREFNAKCLVQPGPSSETPARHQEPASRTSGLSGGTHFRDGLANSGHPNQNSGKLQLPRGKFHSLIQDEPLSALLDDLKKSGFSGYGSITIGEENGHLVLDDGICLLASFPPERGSAALQILQTMIDDLVRADLYQLTPAQMQLTMEFNRSYRVSIATSGRPVRMKLQKICEKPLKTDNRETPDAAPVDEDFEEQIRVLESMDMKTMEDQFRHSLTGVLDRLQMTHLIPGQGDEEAANNSTDADGEEND
jgi:hypothetical protein